jgi:hypothetical protein
LRIQLRACDLKPLTQPMRHTISRWNAAAPKISSSTTFA